MKKPKVMVDDGCEYDSHPSQDTTNRFAVDQLIRDHGWQILSRKNKKPPVWVNPQGVRLTQDEVLMLIPEDKIRAAEELAITYFCY